MSRTSTERVVLNDLLVAEGIDPSRVKEVSLEVEGVAWEDRDRPELWRKERYVDEDGRNCTSIAFIGHGDDRDEWEALADYAGPGRYEVWSKDGRRLAVIRR